MSEQETYNAEIRMEIDELKSDMTKLTEMLQILISRGQPAQTPQRPVIRQNQKWNRSHFDPIPMTYTELYLDLVRRGLITTKASPPPPNPHPVGFRTNLHCAFHEGAPGHDLEHCFALKARVRELVRTGILNFTDGHPNVQKDPLPVHQK